MSKYNRYGKSKSKYHNKKVTYDGHTFDSRHEAERYIILRDKALRNEIQGLELQKKFILIPSQKAPDTINERGRKVKGKVIERECAYYADFVYYDTARECFVVEDAKGVRTEAYKIKKKLMLYKFGIKIEEV